MQIGELLQWAAAELSAVGITDCISDIHLLLGRCLGKSRTQLLAAARDTISEEAELEFRKLLTRRKNREPVAYILGEQEFWSLPFYVTSDVLIPRPETEFLLETVLAHVSRHGLGNGRIVDLCSGSGVIAAVLALELGKKVVAVDLSAAALAITGRNCRRHGVGQLVLPVRSDLFSGLRFNRGAALVVSNPPYVSRQALEEELEPEVAAHEPRLALDGGPDGLELIVRIRAELPQVLCPGGLFFMEIGCDQGEAVRRMFSEPAAGSPGFARVQVLQDLAGRDRILHAQL